MKITLRERIFSYLKRHPNEWINGQALGDMAHNLPEFYKHETTGRECRRLAQDGAIESKELPSIKGKKSIHYRYVQTN